MNEQRVAVVCCQQGNVSVIASNFMSSYREVNGGELTDFIALMGDISLITVDNVPESLRDTMWRSLEVAIGRHGATSLFIFGHTPCLMRSDLNIDGENNVREQLIAASKIIPKRFPENKPIIRMFIVKIDDGKGLGWSISEL